MPQISVSKKLKHRLDILRQKTGASPSKYIEAMLDSRFKRGPKELAKRTAGKWALSCGRPLDPQHEAELREILSLIVTEQYIEAQELLEILIKQIMIETRRMRQSGKN